MILPRPGSASGGTRPRAQRAWRARPAASMGRDVGAAGLLFEMTVKIERACRRLHSRMRRTWYRLWWRIRGGTAAFEANSKLFASSACIGQSNISSRAPAALRHARVAQGDAAA